MSTMRIGGLASGMDIDSIVEKLMVAERTPMDKLEQQKQIYEWQRDAYRDVNTKMTTLDTYIADNFILKSLNTKSATSSNSDLVSAVASGTASGSLSIEGVMQLAEAARGIGTKVNATSTTKVSSLFTNGETMPTTFTLNAIDTKGVLGKEVSISIDGNTTVGELITKINDSNTGVTALFENGKLSLTAKNTGKEVNGGDAMTTNENGKALFAKLGLTKIISDDTSGKNAMFVVNGIATERTTNAYSLNGYNITLKSTFNESKAYSELEETAKKTLEFAEENLNDTLTSLASTYSVALTGTLEEKIAVVHTKITSKINEHQNSVNTANNQLTTAREVDLNGQTAGSLYDALSEEAKTALSSADSFADLTAFPTIDLSNFDALKDVNSRIKAIDTATIKLNNAKASEVSLLTMETSHKNAKDSLNDITNKAATTTLSTGAVTMTSSTNVDEIIEKVKEFVATYNGFITDLTSKTKESKYSDYKPLTTLQKNEMEENEITLWETKAKSGLLRSDSILTSGLSSLRGLVYQTNYGVTNQKYNALYTIGISTSKDYTSGGKLEIDETKLRAALEDDPDAVVQLLTMRGDTKATVTNSKGETVTADTQGFMRKIRAEMDKIEKKIDDRAGRGTMADTQYTLGKYLRNVDDRLESWEDKLEEIETRYWKKFTAMETMINKANSQSTSLSSLFA